MNTLIEYYSNDHSQYNYMHIKETFHIYRVYELIIQILYKFILLLLVKTTLQPGHNFAELSWHVHISDMIEWPEWKVPIQ